MNSVNLVYFHLEQKNSCCNRTIQVKILPDLNNFKWNIIEVNFNPAHAWNQYKMPKKLKKVNCTDIMWTILFLNYIKTKSRNLSKKKLREYVSNSKCLRDGKNRKDSGYFDRSD
jgi:hypothetical protein